MKKFLILGVLVAFSLNTQAGKDDEAGELVDRKDELVGQSKFPPARVRSALPDKELKRFAAIWRAGKTAATRALRTDKAEEDLLQLLYEAGASNTLIDQVLSTSTADETISTRAKLEALGVWDEMPLVKAHLRPHALDPLMAWITAHEGGLAGSGFLTRLPAEAQPFIAMLEGLIVEHLPTILPFTGMIPAFGDIHRLPLGDLFGTETKKTYFSIGLSFAFAMDDRTVAGDGADGALTKARAGGLTGDQERGIGEEIFKAIKARFAFSVSFTSSVVDRIATSNTVRTPGNTLIQNTNVFSGFKAAMDADKTVVKA